MKIWLDSEAFQTFVYGGEMRTIYALIILMFIDMVTGVAKALKNKNLWSRKSTYGFGRKVLVFMIIILANIIDSTFNFNGVLVYVTVIFYLLNEALSIVENYALLGGKIPNQLREALELLKEKNDAVDQIEKRVKVNENVTIEVKKESDNNEKY